MPTHKCRNTIWCALSGQDGWKGGMQYVRFQEYSSNTSSTIGTALMPHIVQMFRSYFMINMTKIYVVCCFSKASCLSETVKGIKSMKEHFR